MSIALTSNVFTELANTMKNGEGVLKYTIVFIKYQFKRVSDDVTAFHRIMSTKLLND